MVPSITISWNGSTPCYLGNGSLPNYLLKILQQYFVFHHLFKYIQFYLGLMFYKFSSHYKILFLVITHGMGPTQYLLHDSWATIIDFSFSGLDGKKASSVYRVHLNFSSNFELFCNTSQSFICSQFIQEQVICCRTVFYRTLKEDHASKIICIC